MVLSSPLCPQQQSPPELHCFLVALTFSSLAWCGVSTFCAFLFWDYIFLISLRKTTVAYTVCAQQLYCPVKVSNAEEHSSSYVASFLNIYIYCIYITCFIFPIFTFSLITCSFLTLLHTFLAALFVCCIIFTEWDVILSVFLCNRCFYKQL